MTAEIINLKQARKARARAEKDEASARNRAVFGRTKTERHAAGAEIERAGRLLDGSKLDQPASGAPVSGSADPEDDGLDPGNLS